MKNTVQGNTANLKKVTIYTRSGLGNITAIEAKLIDHGTTSYAQYDSVPFATFIPKRARKARTIRQGFRPDMVIVAGWNQPQPPSAFCAPEVQGPVTVSRGRYASCDPRWQSDFDTMLASTEVEILADFRGHNSHNRFAS